MIGLSDRQKNLLAQHMDRFGSTVLMVLAGGRIKYVNSAAIKLLGKDPTGSELSEVLPPEEVSRLTGMSGPGEKIILHPDTSQLLALVCRVYVEDGEQLVVAERELQEDTTRLQLSSITDEMTNVARKLTRRNRELERANETINKLVRIDPLTGVANRRSLLEALPGLVGAARRLGLPLAVILLDIDHFKRVNDMFGHAEGDRVLVSLGELLKRRCRKDDHVARFGGEEFTILLPGIDSEQAGQLAERLRREVMSAHGDTVKITASFGVTELRPGDTHDSLIKRADDAMYTAKRKGRNRVVTI